MVRIIKLYDRYRYTNDESILEEIKVTILNGDCDINEVDIRNDNLLSRTLYDGFGQPEKYRLLLDELSFFLINNGIDINNINDKGTTPLHLACERDSLKLVELMISKDVSKTINTTDAWGLTPLQYIDNKDLKDKLENDIKQRLDRQFLHFIPDR